MDSKSYEFPSDYRYSETDEWIHLDGATARIGITDYAQSQLSDIVFVELPDVGTQIEAGQPFGVVESVKAVSDLLAPVSGEVVAVHEALEDHAEWVNEEPYERGWIIEIEPEDPDVIETLMSAEDYRLHVESRSEQ
ncbi:MAG: glycine cleavage system protein GcvH [Myxococcota bacterium]